MKVIEQQMLDAIDNKTNWSKDNTSVTYYHWDNTSHIYLHNNLIAIMYHEFNLEVCENTLKRYPTNTTKSRLRALGVNVTTKRGVTYLNGVAL